MYLYKNSKALSPLKEIPFKLELDIQKLFERNLSAIANLKLIKSEFRIKNNRIDTLAFDEESKSFVIIEYKRNQNYSVIDQGVSYLNLMLEYKSDFIVEYNETQKDNIKRGDVDWSQSKIVFVAPSFTDFQKQSTNFNDLAIELWEIKQFENDIVVLNPIKKSKSAPSIKQIQKGEASEISKITQEIKVYTEEDHLLGKSETIRELYEDFKSAIQQVVTDVNIEAKKSYIAFKRDTNVVDIEIQNKALKIWINAKKGTLNDAKGITEDKSEKGHWGNGDYSVTVKDTSELEYIMSLIKQLLK